MTRFTSDFGSLVKKDNTMQRTTGENPKISND